MTCVTKSKWRRAAMSNEKIRSHSCPAKVSGEDRIGYSTCKTIKAKGERVA